MARTSAGSTLVPNPEAIDKFLETQTLEKTLVFPKTPKHANYLCCIGWLQACGSVGISCCITPMMAFCPGKISKHMGLQLSEDSVIFHSAANDCCCHVAESQTRTPLDKIIDVQLTEGCMETCFGLRTVNVQTASMGGPMAEISAPFLSDPDKAKEAIQLAVRLQKAGVLGGGGGLAAPAPAGGMTRAGASPLDPTNVMHLRLKALELLVTKGVLTQAEFTSAKPRVLTSAGEPPLGRLLEAKQMADEGLVSQEEYGAMRQSLVEQLMGH